ncbi:MAG: cysteine desulfurase [Deltaproteobacteria bacterium]|nr:cysteine desulfurase [Deltaproteobacteria bacterium]
MSALIYQTDSLYDVNKWRQDFPILNESVHGMRLAYLDNAATTQKPKAVIDAITNYYTHDNANVHRAVHMLSSRATKAYENARIQAQRFLNAKSKSEIVFVRGATEAINLVAQTFVRSKVMAGDEILISGLEHHSNIVPWQLICDELGVKLKVIPIADNGDLELDKIDELITSRTRFLAVTHVSNALGTIVPISELITKAHQRNIPVLIDGAQAAPHINIDVQALEPDFYVFSGHKVYGPTGIGVLYAKLEHLESMPPWQGGGDMILSVTFEKTTYNEPPYKFEAGTPDIAGAIGLGAALKYVRSIGIEQIHKYETSLLEYATQELQKVAGLRIVGTSVNKAAIISFVLDDVHPHDIATIIDQAGVAIRSGHHCAQPIMDRYCLPATARASLALYNTHEEIDRLVTAVVEARKVFG